MIWSLINLDWTATTASSGTGGTFLKSEITDETGHYYLKMSSYDSYRGVYGNESIYEVIASRLGVILGVPVLEYDLLQSDITLDNKEVRANVSISRDFRNPGESKQAFDDFYIQNRLNSDESPLDLLIRMNMKSYVDDMFIFDYIIINRDRHGANIELLKSQNGKLRISPLFDNGLSLMCSDFKDADYLQFDVMKDRSVNNFVGTRSLEENLRFVSKDYYLYGLQEDDYKLIFDGLENVLSPIHRNKIWDIIWRRYNYVKKFLDS